MEVLYAMWGRWYQTARLRHDVARWQALGKLSPAAVRFIRQQCEPMLQPRDWMLFFRHLCAWLGCVLLASAVVCAVAANWDRIGPIARLLGLQCLLVVTVAASLLPRLAPRARTLLLLLSTVMLGALLALVGQTYQTGADPWQLFATWALLMLPWTLASASVVLCLLGVLIGNVAIFLWGEQSGHGGSHAVLAIFTLWNAGALIAWEAGRMRWAWLRAPAGTRVLSALLVGVLAAYAAGQSMRAGTFITPALMWWALVTMGAGMFYRYGRRDVATLAVLLLGVIVVMTTQVAVHLSWDVDHAILLALLALVVLAQAGLAAAWLRRLAGELP